MFSDKSSPLASRFLPPGQKPLGPPLRTTMDGVRSVKEGGDTWKMQEVIISLNSSEFGHRDTMTSVGPSGATSSAKSSKRFPVDVQDNDRFTRGFVQDVLHDGRVLVYLDGENDPFRTIETGRLFEPRSLTVPFNMDRSKIGWKVEVFVRLSPGSAARWYPGIVDTVVGLGTLVDVHVGGGVIHKGVFQPTAHSSDVQWPVARTGARFVKFPVDIPKGMEIHSTYEEFCELWEMRSGTVVVALDRGKRVLWVLDSVPHTRPSVGIFGTILAELSNLRGRTKAEKRPSAGSPDHGDQPMQSISRGKKKRTQAPSNQAESMEASNALAIPEMLLSVVRLLDLKDRQTLRGVNQSWREIMDSAAVCRSAHFDDTIPPVHMAIQRCRYFSRLHRDYLTTIAVHCTDDRPVYANDAYFVRLLAFMGPALVPRLKTLLLYNGRVDSVQLVYLLVMKNAPRIILKNVIVQRLVLGSMVLAGVHARIESGVLDPLLLGNIPIAALADKNWFFPQEAAKEKAVVMVRNLVVGILDKNPLGRPEEDILADVTGFWKLQYHRTQLATALKT